VANRPHTGNETTLTQRPTVREPFDFDRIEVWGPELHSALRSILPDATRDQIRNSDPKYLEDARDRLFELVDRESLIEGVSEWFRQQSVFAYHGTRVTEDELASIRRDGLLPLNPASRATRLRRSLSSHPKWAQVEPRLAEAIQLFGDGKYGRREGQVHLTISRAGLVRSFNYYLDQGSEFDWHVAHHLLGEEGQALVAADGAAILIKMRVPGTNALAACNPYGPFGSNLPNLVSDVLRVWELLASGSRIQQRSPGTRLRHAFQRMRAFDVDRSNYSDFAA
jgi:hypothetical protein